MLTSKSQQPQKIGIMADSHGQVECMLDALAFFRKQDCDSLYHLGDICDSAHPQTADQCVQLLQQKKIHAVKGNNDHQVVVNHLTTRPAYISTATIEFLQHLPMIIDFGEIVLAHSLPFVKDRGLSSMVGPLGVHEADLFFGMNSHKILLRGHSHLPEIVRSRCESNVTKKLMPGESLQIAGIIPAIVTCGAVDHGFVMVWDVGRQTISSYKLNRSVAKAGGPHSRVLR